MTATRTGTSTAAINIAAINTPPNTLNIHEGFDATSAASDVDVAAPLEIHTHSRSSQMWQQKAPTDIPYSYYH
jgi:hypothetical protein